MSELGRVQDKASWRETLLSVLTAWNRHQVWKILTGVVVIWIAGGTALHFAERGTNPAFEMWGESLWNVWVTLFSGLGSSPNTPVGRLVVSVVLVVGVALAGLFTASVASILVERSLRSREMSNLEMSDHLVLCNWSPRALEWIREVHSGIVTDKRPVVIVHDTPDEVVLPDKQDEAAFNDVYIVKGEPANEVILRRAKVAQECFVYRQLIPAEQPAKDPAHRFDAVQYRTSMLSDVSQPSFWLRTTRLFLTRCSCLISKSGGAFKGRHCS